jgi:alpha-D-xyloside xylohydrolase
MHWDDKSRTLTIADRTGSFDGMLAQRKFNLVLGDKAGANAKPIEVSYSGKKVSVKM